MGHGCCIVYTKQTSLPRLTRDALLIGQKAWMLLKSFSFDPTDLRGVGIQITKLENDNKKANKIESAQSTLHFGTFEEEIGRAHV